MSELKEWDDQRSIPDEEQTHSKVKEKQASTQETEREVIEQAIADAYEEQHTTTPLDIGGRFNLQTLDPVTVGESEGYRFRVKRILWMRPAGTFTGTVRRNGEEWVVEYE